MATRHDYQVAWDILKNINIINDLVDCAAYIMRDIDPRTGEPYRNRETGEEFSLFEIKQELGRIRTNVTGYYNLINNYIDVAGVPRIATALAIVGVDAVQAKADMENLKTVVETAISQVQSASTKLELIPIGEYIDANTDKLDLIRRFWSL